MYFDYASFIFDHEEYLTCQILFKCSIFETFTFPGPMTNNYNYNSYKKVFWEAKFAQQADCHAELTDKVI